MFTDINTQKNLCVQSSPLSSRSSRIVHLSPSVRRSSCCNIKFKSNRGCSRGLINLCLASLLSTCLTGQAAAKGAFTLSSKVPSLSDEFARRANSSSKKTDIAALPGANLSNTRRANSSSIDFAR
jgi:hypothetical protein